ncbi:MAG: hypothetical protein EXR33_02435 [Betaproteobacteria bacterium]|nr:hypothetical protein [Betaproteobacteria bacterium]
MPWSAAPAALRLVRDLLQFVREFDQVPGGRGIVRTVRQRLEIQVVGGAGAHGLDETEFLQLRQPGVDQRVAVPPQAAPDDVAVGVALDDARDAPVVHRNGGIYAAQCVVAGRGTAVVCVERHAKNDTPQCIMCAFHFLEP